ncbi:hypothetical protein [Nocardioides sp.]|uniref:hypothetical protein n=1 Tax=Nocardioides sp. TaxID=35761 RepID=UPI0039E3BF89
MTLLILPLTEGRATGWPLWTWACRVSRTDGGYHTGVVPAAQAGLGFGSAVVGSIYFGFDADHAFARTAFLLAAVMAVVTPLTRLLRPRS